MSESTFASGLHAQTPNLRNYARALTRDPVRAEDLVQETLARALAKQHRWQPGTNLRAWLFTLMRNQFLTQLNTACFQEIPIAPDDHAILGLAAPSDQEMGLLVRDLKRALLLLPADQRRTVWLVGYHGLSYEEAAEHEGIPVGTIRSRLSRGRAELSLIMDGGAPPLRRHRVRSGSTWNPALAPTA